MYAGRMGALAGPQHPRLPRALQSPSVRREQGAETLKYVTCYGVNLLLLLPPPSSSSSPRTSTGCCDS
eukprot:4328139-Pyramimonas_sp.AAC.1